MLESEMDEFQVPPAKKMRFEPDTSFVSATLCDTKTNDDNDQHEASTSYAQSTPSTEQNLGSEVATSTQSVRASFFLPGIERGIAESGSKVPESENKDVVRAVQNQAPNPLSTPNISTSEAHGEPAQKRQSLQDKSTLREHRGITDTVSVEHNGSLKVETEEECKEEQDVHQDAVMLGVDSTVSEAGALEVPNIEQGGISTTIPWLGLVKQEVTGEPDHQSGFECGEMEGERQEGLVATAEALNGYKESNPDNSDLKVFPLNGTEQTNPVGKPDQESHEAEFEYDSSPYESSSSDSSSSDSSSDEDSDDNYQMLDPAEQARRLMEDDGGSDDEGAKKGATNNSVRTLNEKPEEVTELPDITVTLGMKIEELGNVETVVENVVLIKAKTSGEYQVLETASLLCLEDRKVIGVVSETLGRVEQPLYGVRFTDASSISHAGLSLGKTVYYVPEHSTFVFTKALKAVKGSDASNIHDEEVAADEMEFSDDEAEAEYKRGRKMEKQAKRDGRGGLGAASTRTPRFHQNMGVPRRTDRDGEQDYDITMNYDDSSNADEPYTPLSRPANLHEIVGKPSSAIEFPQEGYSRGPRGGRGRGDRHRGGTRGRGKGRGGFQHPRHPRHPLPPPPKFGSSPVTQKTLGVSMPGQAVYQASSSPPSQNPYSSQGSQHGPVNNPAHQQFGGPNPYPMHSEGPHLQPYHQQNYQPIFQANQQASHQSFYQSNYPPNYGAMQYPHAQQNHHAVNQHPPQQAQTYFHPPSAAGSPPLPPGAFVNPNFFANQAYQQQPGHGGSAPGYHETNRR